MIFKGKILVFMYLNIILVKTTTARSLRQTQSSCPYYYYGCSWGCCGQGTNCGYRYYPYNGYCNGPHSCPNGYIACAGGINNCCRVTCPTGSLSCSNNNNVNSDAYCCPQGTGCCPATYSGSGGLCCPVQGGNPNQCPSGTVTCQTAGSNGAVYSTCCTTSGSCGSPPYPCCPSGANSYSTYCSNSDCDGGYCAYGRK